MEDRAVPGGRKGKARRRKKGASYPWYFRDHNNPTKPNKADEGIKIKRREGRKNAVT